MRKADEDVADATVTVPAGVTHLAVHADGDVDPTDGWAGWHLGSRVARVGSQGAVAAGCLVTVDTVTGTLAADHCIVTVPLGVGCGRLYLRYLDHPADRLVLGVVLGYGGDASGYAERQHEDLSLRHPDPTNPKSRAQGQAKYLETPVRERIPALRSDLRARLEGLMKK